MRRKTLLAWAAAAAAALPPAAGAQVTAPVPEPTAPPSAAQPAPSAVEAPKPAPAPKPTVTITPYGFLLLQSFWNDGPFQVKDYPGQVLANGDGGAYLISARGTRFGFKIGLPTDPWTGANLSAVIEADFKGGFPQQSTSTTTCPGTAPGSTATCTTTTTVPSTGWYNSLFRIRLGFVQASWDAGPGKLTLVLGQDWRVVAPLAPTSLAYGYDQMFTQAGNLNVRDPQIKAIYDVAPASGLGLNVQAAMLSPQDAFTGAPTAGADYGAGIRSRMPNFEARAAGVWREGGKKVAEVGLAGGIGWRRYNNSGAAVNQTSDTTTRVGAVDAAVNLPFVTVQGEGFVSDGMEDSYLGLLSSAVAVGPGGYPTLTNVQSKGGWIQAVLKPIPQINIPVGYGVETVRWQGVVAAGTRTRNSQFHAGVLFNVTNPWKFGFEYTHTLSGYGAGISGGGAATSISANQYVLVSKLDF